MLKNNIFSIIFFNLLLFTGTNLVKAETINNFKSSVTIEKDSTIQIEETIEYDFGSVYKHGIFRNIPYIKTNKDGKRYILEVKPANVFIDNTPVQYSINTDNDNVNIKIGDPNKTITGAHIYKINYSVKGAFEHYEGFDELYWNVTGNDWNVQIQQAEATVNFDKVDSNFKTLGTNCYTGIKGSTSNFCNVAENPNYIKVNSSLLAQTEGLTFASKFTPDILILFQPQLQKINSVSFSTLYASSFVFLIMTNGLSFLIVFLIWFFKGRDPKTQIIVREYEAPKKQNGDVFSPIELGAIVDETIDPKDLSAEIINLAIKKYIVIQEQEKELIIFKTKDIKFSRGPAFLEDPELKKLTTYQKEILIGLNLVSREEYLLSDLKQTFTQTFEGIKGGLYKEIVKDGYFKNNPQTIRTTYYVLGFVFFVVGNVVLGIALIVFAKSMPRKTQLGAEINRKGLGLKQYLESQDRQFEFMEKNYDLFEKLLPYAIVFGVVKIWAEKFKDLTNYNPDWYTSNTSIKNFNSIMLIDSLNNNMSSMEGFYRPSSSSSSHGFSSGFSGGSSGGGGGGGGGGSW